MITQTNKVKDINKILDYIEAQREIMISEGAASDKFDKLDYEVQFKHCAAAQYFLWLNEMAEDSHEFYMDMQELPLRMIYAHVADFVLGLEEALDLEEIEVDNEYGYGIFKHIVAHLYDGKLEDYDFKKIDAWLEMTVQDLDKTKEQTKDEKESD